MRAIVALLASAFALNAQMPQSVILRTSDGATIHAHEYGKGRRGIVLAHGGRFNKETWRDQARTFETAGFRVIALDFRGYGASTGPGQKDTFTAPLHLDVLAAIDYLRSKGCNDISLIGGSIGGSAAANAAVEAGPAKVNRLVLLAATPGKQPDKLTGNKLMIIAREDADGAGLRLPRYSAEWDKVPEPKRIVIVDGSAHAQFLFFSDERERVIKEIMMFLSAR